jgi:hypothetical protein
LAGRAIDGQLEYLVERDADDLAVHVDARMREFFRDARRLAADLEAGLAHELVGDRVFEFGAALEDGLFALGANEVIGHAALVRDQAAVAAVAFVEHGRGFRAANAEAALRVPF